MARQVPAVLLRPVEEEELAEAGPLDPLEELLGHDLVGVDVVAVEHADLAVDSGDVVHCRLLAPGADVDEAALDGGGGGHLRGDEVGAPAAALAPLEVAVRGRGAALAGRERVRVHAEAHRAAGDAPVEPGRLEDLVEALPLGLGFDLLRAGHDHRVDGRSRPCGP